MTCGATAAKGLTQGHSLQAVCLGEAQVSALPASAQIGPWLVPGEPKAQSLLDFLGGIPTPTVIRGLIMHAFKPPVI